MAEIHTLTANFDGEKIRLRFSTPEDDIVHFHTRQDIRIAFMIRGIAKTGNVLSKLIVVFLTRDWM